MDRARHPKHIPVQHGSVARCMLEFKVKSRLRTQLLACEFAFVILTLAWRCMAVSGECSSLIEEFGNVLDLIVVWDAEVRKIMEQKIGCGEDAGGSLTMLELVCKRLFECSTELDLLKSATSSAHKVLFIGKNGNGKTTLINKLVHESFEEACRSSAESPADAPDKEVSHSDHWACTTGSRSSHALGTDEYKLLFNVETLAGSRPIAVRSGRSVSRVSDAFHREVDGTREPEECERPFLPTDLSSSTTAIRSSICFGEEYEVTITYKSASDVAFVVKHFHSLIDELQEWSQDPESTDDFTSKVRPLGHWTGSSVSVDRTAACCFCVGATGKWPLGHARGALCRGCQYSSLQD